MKLSNAGSGPESTRIAPSTGGLEIEKPPPAPPCAMVIFGAAGDLTKRLVVPALFNLARSGQLSEGFRLVGVDLAEGSEIGRAHV